jgi:hypothetical protein
MARVARRDAAAVAAFVSAPSPRSTPMIPTRDLWTLAWREYRVHDGVGSPCDPADFLDIVNSLPRHQRSQLQAAWQDGGLRGRQAAWLHTHALCEVQRIGELRRTVQSGWRLDRPAAIYGLKARLREVRIYRERARVHGWRTA